MDGEVDMAGRAGVAGIVAGIARYGVTKVHGRAKALGQGVVISRLGPVAVADQAVEVRLRSGEAAQAVAAQAVAAQAVAAQAVAAQAVVAQAAVAQAAGAAVRVVDKAAVRAADTGIAKRRKDHLKPGLSAGLFFSRSISPFDR
jgi:hypothetical protein